MMSQESDIGWRYDLISALQTLCEDANVLLQAYGGVPPDLAAAIAEHAAAIDPALEGAPLDTICRAAALMIPQSAAKRQAAWRYERGEERTRGKRDEEKEKVSEWEEREEGRTRAPSSMGWFEMLPREILSEILQYPGTHRLGTASREMRRQVAAEDVWLRRACERAAAKTALPLEALCIDANPGARCAKACSLALADNPHAFFAGLLRAAFLMLGIDPERPEETGSASKSRALWWPVTPRIGYLTGEEGVLAFQPAVLKPLPPDAPVSEWDLLKLPRVDLILALRPCGTGTSFSARPAYGSLEEIQDVVLRFAVRWTYKTEGSRRWEVNWILMLPVHGPHGPTSPGFESMFVFREPSGAGTPSRGARPTQPFEQDHIYYARWDDVVEHLKEYVDLAMRAWHFRPLYFEIQFPGWLHIARADTVSLREWIPLVHSAFDPLVVLGGALPVRTAEGRDGIVTRSEVLSSPSIYSHLDIPFGISPLNPGLFSADQWRAAVDAWAADFFYGQGGRVRLPHPGHYVAMKAALCFPFPRPIPPREGGTP